MPQLHTWQPLSVCHQNSVHLWLSGRALAAQARGVLGSTPGDCRPFHFFSILPYLVRFVDHANENTQTQTVDPETLRCLGFTFNYTRVEHVFWERTCFHLWTKRNLTWTNFLLQLFFPTMPVATPGGISYYRVSSNLRELVR